MTRAPPGPCGIRCSARGNSRRRSFSTVSSLLMTERGGGSFVRVRRCVCRTRTAGPKPPHRRLGVAEGRCLHCSQPRPVVCLRDPLLRWRTGSVGYLAGRIVPYIPACLPELTALSETWLPWLCRCLGRFHTPRRQSVSTAARLFVRPSPAQAYLCFAFTSFPPNATGRERFLTFFFFFHATMV